MVLPNLNVSGDRNGGFALLIGRIEGVYIRTKSQRDGKLFFSLITLASAIFSGRLRSEAYATKGQNYSMGIEYIRFFFELRITPDLTVAKEGRCEKNSRRAKPPRACEYIVIFVYKNEYTYSTPAGSNKFEIRGSLLFF